MLKQLFGAMFAFTVTLGIAAADEFRAYIEKVQDDTITYQKYKLGKGDKEDLRDGAPMTITVAKDAKIAYGERDLIDKKIVPGNRVEGGLKADIFHALNRKYGRPAIITTNGEGKVTQILMVGVAASERPGQDGFKPLFNGKNLDGWKTFLRTTDKGDPKTVFTVKDGEIQCSGDPWGYFYTDKSYKNYIIRYSWTYPKDQPEKTTMNSGLLLHIQEPHQVWPKSIEPQGRYKDHGKIYFPGWAKDDKTAKDTTFDEKAQKDALKASYEWNTTEATVRGDGTISVKINGVAVSTAKTPLTSGPIGFQSEGARIHFKDIKIKMLD